jgi:hypothetical protein
VVQLRLKTQISNNEALHRRTYRAPEKRELQEWKTMLLLYTISLRIQGNVFKGPNVRRLRWKTVQSSLIECNIIRYDTIQYETMQRNATQHNTTQNKTTQHNTTQHNTTQHNTAQHKKTQHRATQHNTTQYITILHNTAMYSIIPLPSMAQDVSPMISGSSLSAEDRTE